MKNKKKGNGKKDKKNLILDKTIKMKFCVVNSCETYKTTRNGVLLSVKRYNQKLQKKKMDN